MGNQRYVIKVSITSFNNYAYNSREESIYCVL